MKPMSILIALIALLITASPSFADIHGSDDWGGYGSGNGQFNRPRFISGTGDFYYGYIYVTDTDNNRVQYFTADGSFLGKWGSRGYGNGRFAWPAGIAADASYLRVYVADCANHRVQYFTHTGSFLGKWGTRGSGKGQFEYPMGVAIDRPSYNVYVCDRGNHRVQYFSSTGSYLGEWGGYGTRDGQFDQPYGIAVSYGGKIYVADTFNHRVQYFTSTGSFLGKWGSRGSADGQFDRPSGIALEWGSVFVTDYGNDRVQGFRATVRSSRNGVRPARAAGSSMVRSAYSHKRIHGIVTPIYTLWTGTTTAYNGSGGLTPALRRRRWAA